jgi:hypothetical protein
MNKNKHYQRAINEAATAAYCAFMETMMNDPAVNRDEIEEKGRYIQEQILDLKESDDGK